MVGHDPEDPKSPCDWACRSPETQVSHFRSQGNRPNILKMTLCGSEVPQDRWRGRTAGSGMWTQTRESVLGAPCGDSAIPYG